PAARPGAPCCACREAPAGHPGAVFPAPASRWAPPPSDRRSRPRAPGPASCSSYGSRVAPRPRPVQQALGLALLLVLLALLLRLLLAAHEFPRLLADPGHLGRVVAGELDAHGVLGLVDRGGSGFLAQLEELASLGGRGRLRGEARHALLDA